MRVYKFLQEAANFEGIDYIIEEQNANAPRNYFIQGPYLQAGVKNLNSRIYDLNEMVNEVDRYNKEFIITGRALGELGHPENSVEVNLEKCCHSVVKLEQKDNNSFYGKSKVLSTPSGAILKSLITDNIKIGLSSRALGSLKPTGDINLVENFKLICLDVVHCPSINQTVDSILENRQFVIEEGGQIVELACNSLECRLNSLPKKDVDTYIKHSFQLFLEALKK